MMPRLNVRTHNSNMCEWIERYGFPLLSLQNGLKSLNIPPLDPFTIERTSLEYGNGALQGAIKMKNLKTFGMSQAVFRDVRMKIEDGKVETEIDIHFPKIFMEGAYKADIKFNELKLHPKGHFNVTMSKFCSFSNSSKSLCIL